MLGKISGQEDTLSKQAIRLVTGRGNLSRKEI